MAFVRISARARDEAGNYVGGDGYEIRAYQAGTTTLHSTKLDSAGAINHVQPGRPSTSTSTTIAASAAAGQDIVQVASTTGFSVGDVVIVAGGGNREEHIVRAILASPARLQLAANLASTFASGTVGGAECKGAWARYVEDTFDTDVEVKVVSTGKTYPRITFPTKARGYATVADEGTNLTQRSTLNIIGANVKAADNSGSGRTDVTVDGLQTITHTAGTLAIDFASGGTVNVNLQANTGSTTFANPVAGAWYAVRFKQDATGSRTVAFASTIKWKDGTAPTFSTAANKIDMVTLYYDGTDYVGQFSTNH